MYPSTYGSTVSVMWPAGEISRPAKTKLLFVTHPLQVLVEISAFRERRIAMKERAWKCAHAIMYRAHVLREGSAVCE